MHQYIKHGRFLDKNPRTQNDLNEYRINYKDQTVEFDCYNRKFEVIGVFIIDLDDIEKVKYHKWRLDSNGRPITGNCTKSRPRKELSHVLLNVPEGKVVDHIDGNPKNNRRSNLRVCTQSENLCNRSFMTNNNSGCIGVRWSKNRFKWEVEIRKDKKRIHLGRWSDYNEAVYVRRYAEKLLFKEYQYQDNLLPKLEDKNRKEYIENYVGNKLY